MQTTARAALGEYRFHVLLVAADDSYRAVLSDLLSLHGYKVIGARSSTEALLLLREGWAPDIIFFDLVHMTRDGCSMLQPLLEEHDDARVIFIAPSMAPRPTEDGAPLVLRMPVDFRRILKVVERYCAVRDAQGRSPPRTVDRSRYLPGSTDRAAPTVPPIRRRRSLTPA